MLRYDTLVHHYDAISAQTDDSVQRLHEFVKFYSAMFKHVSLDVAKIIAKHEKASREETVRPAQDFNIFVMCNAAQSTMMKMLLSLKTLLDHIRTQIWAPLKDFSIESAKSKERIDKDYKSSVKKLADLQKSMEKQEQDCLKSLAELKKKRTDPKLVDATRKKFAAYELTVKQAQTLQQSLHGEVMPRNLREFESLEQSRLAHTSEALRKLSTLSCDSAQASQTAAESLKQALTGLQADAELKQIVSYWAKRPAVTQFEAIEYNLPCRDSDIVSANFEAEIEKRAARQALKPPPKPVVEQKDESAPVFASRFSMDRNDSLKRSPSVSSTSSPPAKVLSSPPAPSQLAPGAVPTLSSASPQQASVKQSPPPPSSVIPTTSANTAPKIAYAKPPTPSMPAPIVKPSTTESVSVAAPPPPPADPTKDLTPEQKMKRTRDQVAQEIVDTETSYLKSLETAITVFLKPLERVCGDLEAAVLSKDQIATMFSNLETLYQLNSQFREHVHKRRSVEWDTNDQMGDLFLNFAPYFKMYTLYINNHDNATKLLAALSKDVKFSAFLAETNSAVPLPSLLIEPVQRVPRYKLLLEVLVKNTPPGHPDYENLNKAFDAVSAVAKHINEQLRRRENQDKIAELESRFVGGAPGLTSPSRVLIRQGMLVKQCRNKDVPYEFFLFNDMLAYASKIPMSGMYKLHRTLDINSAFHVADDLAKNNNAFMIVSSTKSFKLISSSAEDKARWLKDLTNCMVSASRTVSSDDNAHSTQPVWQQDSTAKDCPYCKMKFNMVRRRHHCRKCGNLVCNECSKRSFSLVPGGVKERVCDNCAMILFKKRAPPSPADLGNAEVSSKPESVVPEIAPETNPEQDVSSSDDEFPLPTTQRPSDKPQDEISEGEDEEGLTIDELGPLPPNWLLYYTDEDRLRYYYNTATGDTIWDRPTA